MRRSCLIAGCLALALPALLLGAPSDPASDTPTSAVARKAAVADAQAAKAAAPFAPHMRSRSVQWVFVDPKTGRLTDRPADAQAMKAMREEAAAAAAAAAPEVLEAMPGVTAAGGLLVHLDDRFTSFLVATVGKDGKVTIRHEPVPRDARGKE
jgi:hypothetical protein